MRWLFLACIRFYRLGISPFLPVACRFAPSCSVYAYEAIKTYGALHGGLLALKRILRCHPWGASGFDPVPCIHNESIEHE